VLIVDDNPGFLSTFELLLRKSGFEVTTAAAAPAALAAARAGFDVMLLDVRLGADDGLDVLRALRHEGVSGRVIVITGFDIDGVEEESRRLGAEFVDRWAIPDPVELVQRALSSVPSAERCSTRPVITPPILRHWADAVAKGVDAPDDPKSIALWARAIGKSDSALREICELSGISAKNSCDLVRVLRAARLSSLTGRPPSEWLDVADGRTLKHLLASAGVPALEVVSLEDVLQHQTLVADDGAVGLLSRALRLRGFLERHP
jgi:CheY-like chemotaxis protein